VNDPSVCNRFCFMVFGEAGLAHILLFPGVTSAFALFLSNLIVNRRLQRVGGGWP
jgi:hypothetical protein